MFKNGDDKRISLNTVFLIINALQSVSPLQPDTPQWRAAGVFTRSHQVLGVAFSNLLGPSLKKIQQNFLGSFLARLLILIKKGGLLQLKFGVVVVGVGVGVSVGFGVNIYLWAR